MKRIISLFSLVALIVGIVSCQKDEDEIIKIDVTSVSLNLKDVILIKGDSFTLTATVKPDNATDKVVTWQSDRPDVAIVNNGVVTAVNVGDAVITASVGDCKAKCKISVQEGIEITFGGMSTDTPVINGAGGSTTITFTASGDWNLTTNESWIKVVPQEGEAGTYTITITTTKNSTGKDRNGTISLTPGKNSQTLAICQRPYIYERNQVASGTITNSVKLTYNGTQWSRIYTVLPVPKSNLYQDIKSVNTYNGTVYDCPDSLNRYVVTDLNDDEVPASGKNVILESIYTVAYEVTAKINLIDNIPPYDLNSVECVKYLGVEDDDLVDPTNSQVITVANNLWKDANGNLIDYARRCYEWTATNITYGNMNTGLHTITDLMNTKTGDCGNFSSVFISLLRAKGIPARHIVMISPQESGYHVRAEFYIPAYGWIPADPTFKNSNPSGDFFGKFTGKYIIMSFGVNPIIKDPWGNDFKASLLQTYYLWHWWYEEGTNINFQHIFSKF